MQCIITRTDTRPTKQITPLYDIVLLHNNCTYISIGAEVRLSCQWVVRTSTSRLYDILSPSLEMSSPRHSRLIAASPMTCREEKHHRITTIWPWHRFEANYKRMLWVQPGLSARMSCWHAPPRSAGLLSTFFESVSPEDASFHDAQRRTVSTICDIDDKLIVAAIPCPLSGQENSEAHQPGFLHLRKLWYPAHRSYDTRLLS